MDYINTLFCFILIAFAFQRGYGQIGDSIRVHGELEVQGIVQTGNVSQIGGNLQSELTFQGKYWYFAPYMNYNFFKEDGVVLQHDLWTHFVAEIRPKRQLYPTVMLYYSYATTFGITNSITPGVGLGTSIFDKGVDNYLLVHGLIGHMNTEFVTSPSINKLVALSYFKSAKVLVKDKLNLYWELDTYHSLQGGNVLDSKTN